jgi:SsrA-binding protein
MELISNKKAYFDYEIFETFNTGIELLGHEVKAAKNKKASITGAVVKIYDGQLWLIGATIGPYQEKNTPQGFDPQRPRRLLAQKQEISQIIGKISQKGLTIIPLKLYNKNGKVKLEIGLAKSRKKSDKRELIKERESKKNIKKYL